MSELSEEKLSDIREELEGGEDGALIETCELATEEID
jgi:hypothetical protein